MQVVRPEASLSIILVIHSGVIPRRESELSNIGTVKELAKRLEERPREEHKNRNTEGRGGRQLTCLSSGQKDVRAGPSHHYGQVAQCCHLMDMDIHWCRIKWTNTQPGLSVRAKYILRRYSTFGDLLPQLFPLGQMTETRCWQIQVLQVESALGMQHVRLGGEGMI